MTEVSSEEWNGVRHVTEGTINSLNLKIENNLNEYIVLIVGEHDQGNLVGYVKKIIGDDRVKSINIIEESFQFIHSENRKNFFLIISGTLGEANASQFASISQVISLYVYCMDEDKHKTWSTNIPKIRCTVSNAELLLKQLHADIKQLSGRWHFDEKSFEQADTTRSEWYHLFLATIIYRPSCVERNYDEMIAECEAYYAGMKDIRKKIKDFIDRYLPENAIKEYTADSFFFRVVNHALRTQNMEIIKKFSPFLADLHRQLQNIFHESYKENICSISVAYRGQLLSFDQYEHLRSLCKSENPIIKLTTFGSASLDLQVAMRFLPASEEYIPCLFEIIITNDYKNESLNQLDFSQAFADISSLSHYWDEKEVLFSLLTHFRVIEVGDPIISDSRPWMPITLELISSRMKNFRYNQSDFIKCIQTETNVQNYTDILNLVQGTAENESKFKSVNWQKWWSAYNRQWHMRSTTTQPLPLTVYQCFTDDRFYLRKAVEIHKTILSGIPRITSNVTSFPTLLSDWRCQVIPTKCIALYEQYLKQFCDTNTKNSIECLSRTGQIYEQICDKERALDCYEKILALDKSQLYQKHVEIHERIKNLNKPAKKSRVVKYEHVGMVEVTEKEYSSVNWNIIDNNTNKNSLEERLNQLRKYIEKIEQWYDAAEARIFLCLPYEFESDLSVMDYYRSFLTAMRNYISTGIPGEDETANRSLFLWRYEKHMHKWVLFKALEIFLQRFKRKSKKINDYILPRIERFLKKLTLLIILCVVYVCIDQRTGEINVDNMKLIELQHIRIRQISFFDLHDDELLHSFEALEDKISVTEENPSSIPDDTRFVAPQIDFEDILGL